MLLAPYPVPSPKNLHRLPVRSAVEEGSTTSRILYPLCAGLAAVYIGVHAGPLVGAVVRVALLPGGSIPLMRLLTQARAP